ncbi:MAG: DUF3443 domain-containing protein [Acidobacteriota bacterium]|nr:DUF3443 domain-containing protein [Acidobacteriota bacterium]
MRRAGAAAAVAALAGVLAGCRGSSASTTTTTTLTNTLPLVVDLGPTVNGQSVGYDNSLYTTVSICNPGTATCQSINHILVDTGSSGLRILSSALGLSLTYMTDAKSNGIGNCIQYPDTSVLWGPMALVDVHLAQEVASNIPMQIVAPSNFSGPPAACSTGGVAVSTLSSLGANGILGVGLFRQDCGAACASSSPPNVYFSCPTAGCTPTTVALTAQLQNPVWMFPQDNNGLTITLPQIGTGGAAQVTGTLTFGIGTQTDNALGSALAQAATPKGTFTTTFGGVAYTNSYIDSGMGAYYFLDSTTAKLPNCAANGDAAGYYCPVSPASLTAITSGPNPASTSTIVSQNIAFQVSNALTLIDSRNPAFNNIGGANPGVFAWGLPFFYGRTVFIGIEGQSTTSAGTGPFWAY